MNLYRAWCRAHRRILQIASVGLGLLLIVLAVVNYTALNRQLHSWKLLPEPERLTELYFDDHTHLPATYEPGLPQRFSFTVHNLEYQSITYHYQVLQSTEDGSRQTELTAGEFTLQQDQFKRQPLQITLQDNGIRSKISVKLSFVSKTSQPKEVQVIHYWTARK